MKNILMTIKDCETATIASPLVEKTLELASLCSSKVHIIHIAPPAQQPPYNVDSETFFREVASELRRERNCLQHLAKCMRDVNIDATALLVQGSIISTILLESERLDVDLVILGRHKHGPMYRILMDNTDEGLLAKCSCSIMFVPI
ncbi:MAG: universal stress protein [Gammaproteobacteria bacterium]|nr:universal stress protein [Gammaproteobacteria bacterium]